MELHGVKSNRFAVGAQVTVKAGGLLVYREVKGGEGFGATSPYRQHFGLAQKPKIDSLEIRWPSGVRRQFTGLAANQIIAVEENAQEWVKIK